MKYINRNIEEDIKKRFFKGKAIIIYGPRQSGKTTLVENLLKKNWKEVLYLNGDEADVRESLSKSTSTKLKNLTLNKKFVFIDEAQRIEDIGIVIKLFTDQIKDKQVIATGSSAFELSSGLREPLTGRKYEFTLFPFKFTELIERTGVLEEMRQLEQRLIYGTYPEIVANPSDAETHLKLLADSYLYKDLFILERINKPVILEKLVRALALQVGSEVNYVELGNTIGADRKTVENYIDLLEKAFVVFRLTAFSRNIRNEIKKGRKIYFFDCGIRNALIGNFNRLHTRTDIGALWENYLVSERAKLIYGSQIKNFFWRTVQQQEIDYIEQSNENLSAYEFKWNQSKKVKFSKTFTNAYPESGNYIINKENYENFLMEIK